MSDDFGAKDWTEQFQKLLNPLGIPIPGLGQPTIDPDEIEKKIAELRVVEHWLKTNVGMLEMTIKTLEMQKAALEAMQASSAGVKSTENRRQTKKKKK
jgi:hypothetical protein